MSFLEKYVKARQEKNSVVCVGLDPALPDSRPVNTIPVEIMTGKELSEGMLDWCSFIISETSEHACAVKVNSQYALFLLGFGELAELNALIHAEGMVSILDHKLGDIGSSNESALGWAAKAGFDAVTYSPFAGNILEATKMAHERDLGLIVLTLMSNPEAMWLQKKSLFDGSPLYEKIASEVKKSGADACVVGATGYITEKDVMTVRNIVGDDKIFLVPGIGAQGGSLDKLNVMGENVLVNVGRDIIYSDDPKQKAMDYRYMIKRRL